MHTHATSLTLRYTFIPTLQKHLVALSSRCFQGTSPRVIHTGLQGGQVYWRLMLNIKTTATFTQLWSPPWKLVPTKCMCAHLLVLVIWQLWQLQRVDVVQGTTSFTHYIVNPFHMDASHLFHMYLYIPHEICQFHMCLLHALVAMIPLSFASSLIWPLKLRKTKSTSSNIVPLLVESTPKGKESNLPVSEAQFETHVYSRATKRVVRLIEDFDAHPDQYRGTACNLLPAYLDKVCETGLVFPSCSTLVITGPMTCYLWTATYL